VLAEIGMAGACLARELPDGSLMLIDGHLRAETLGTSEVPVLVLDVTEAEADKLLATLDPLAGMAGQDSEQLAALLRQLKDSGDALAATVWPDYVMDPLLSADWTPPTPDEAGGAGGEEPEGSRSPPLHLTPEQRETVDQAIAAYRESYEDDTLTEGQCIELICRAYLDGQDP
jgi:hypothetical protein